MLFTIIVPVYNVELYIRRCFDSIIYQSYEDFECVVVDDGSTDDSGIICDEYAEMDNRIKVIHKANAGLSSARNVGLDVANGKYILFCDSDDWYEQGTLNELAMAISKSKSDVVIFGFKHVFKTYASDNIFDTKTDNELIKDKLLTNNWSCSACNKCFRREFIGRKRFPFGVLYEDLAFIPRLVFSADTIAVVEKVLYNYDLTREGSITKFRQSDKIMHFFLAQLGNFEFAKSKNRPCTFILLCQLLISAYDCLLFDTDDKSLERESRKFLNITIEKYEKDLVSNEYLSREELKLKYKLYHNKAKYFIRIKKNTKAIKSYLLYISNKIRYILNCNLFSCLW